MKGRENRIEVIVGDRPDANFTRIINAPKSVWYKQPKAGADEAIKVESDDGTTTLISFWHVPPEQAERLLPDET